METSYSWLGSYLIQIYLLFIVLVLVQKIWHTWYWHTSNTQFAYAERCFKYFAILIILSFIIFINIDKGIIPIQIEYREISDADMMMVTTMGFIMLDLHRHSSHFLMPSSFFGPIFLKFSVKEMKRYKEWLIQVSDRVTKGILQPCNMRAFSTSCFIIMHQCSMTLVSKIEFFLKILEV